MNIKKEFSMMEQFGDCQEVTPRVEMTGGGYHQWRMGIFDYQSHKEFVKQHGSWGSSPLNLNQDHPNFSGYRGTNEESAFSGLDPGPFGSLSVKKTGYFVDKPK